MMTDIREEEVAEDYSASLADLVANSKPLITVLTMLADENKQCAKVIVNCIEQHLLKMNADAKLPTMYLIDSIVKNIGQSYISLFAENIDKIFEHTFKQVPENTRAQLYKLRQTWTGIFPSSKLYKLDLLIHAIDSGWPVVPGAIRTSTTTQSASGSSHHKSSAKEALLLKQKELLQLRQEKLELEIRQTKALLQKQGVTTTTVVTPSITTSFVSVSSVTHTDTKSDPPQLYKTAKAVTIAPSTVSSSNAVPITTTTTTTSVVQPLVQSVPTSSVPPPLRINPVSMDLINAAQRVRDPRLRKFELDRIKFNSNAEHNKEDNKSSSHENANISDKKRSTESTTNTAIPSSVMAKPTMSSTATTTTTTTSISTSSSVVGRRADNPNNVRRDVTKKTARYATSEGSLRNRVVTTTTSVTTTKSQSSVGGKQKIDNNGGRHSLESKTITTGSSSKPTKSQLDSNNTSNIEWKISRKLAKRRQLHNKKERLPSTSEAEKSPVIVSEQIIIEDDDDDDDENNSVIAAKKPENVPVVNAVKLFRDSGISEDLLKGNMSEKDRRLAIIKALSAHVKTLSESSSSKRSSCSVVENVSAAVAAIETGTEVVSQQQQQSPVSNKRLSASRATNMLPPSKRNRLLSDEHDVGKSQDVCKPDQRVSPLRDEIENDAPTKKRPSDGSDFSDAPVKKVPRTESNEGDRDNAERSAVRVDGPDVCSQNLLRGGPYRQNHFRNPGEGRGPNLKENRTNMYMSSSSSSSYSQQPYRQRLMRPPHFQEFARFNHPGQQFGARPRNYASGNDKFRGEEDNQWRQTSYTQVGPGRFVQTYTYPSAKKRANSNTNNNNTTHSTSEQDKEGLKRDDADYNKVTTTQVQEVHDRQQLEEVTSLENNQSKLPTPLLSAVVDIDSSESDDDSAVVEVTNDCVNNEKIDNNASDNISSSVQECISTAEEVKSDSLITKIPEESIVVNEAVEETTSQMEIIVPPPPPPVVIDDEKTVAETVDGETNDAAMTVQPKLSSSEIDVEKEVSDKQMKSVGINRPSEERFSTEKVENKSSDVEKEIISISADTESIDDANSEEPLEDTSYTVENYEKVDEEKLTNDDIREEQLANIINETTDVGSVVNTPVEMESIRNDDELKFNDNTTAAVNDIVDISKKSESSMHENPVLISSSSSSSSGCVETDDGMRNSVEHSSVESISSGTVDCVVPSVTTIPPTAEFNKSIIEPLTMDSPPQQQPKTSDVHKEHGADGSELKSTDKTETTNFTADTDIRSLFTTNLPPAVSPPASSDSSNNKVTASTAESAVIGATENNDNKTVFDNPFGIVLNNNGDENSRDIDYRHMFFPFASTAVVSNFPVIPDSSSPRHSVSSANSSSTHNSLSNAPSVHDSNSSSGSSSSSSSSSSSRSRSRSSSRGSYVSDYSDRQSPVDKAAESSSSPYLSPLSVMGAKIPTPPLPPPIFDMNVNNSHNILGDIELPSTPLPPPLTMSYIPPLTSTSSSSTELSYVPSASSSSTTVSYVSSTSSSSSSGVVVPEIPPSNPFMVKAIEECEARSLNINGVPREIRYYDSVAIIFLSWDDPREITFYNGIRNVIVDSRYVIPLYLNRSDEEVVIDGQRYRLRLGAPTKEIFVNGIGYECQFNGPPILINFGPRVYPVKLEGPPPSVNIGTVRRLDLVAGKVNMIIDANDQFPLFLDAKPQKILIEGLPAIIQFVDSLRRILINEIPFMTNYDGLPQSFWFFGKLHYFRISGLPSHIRIGSVNLQNMLQTRLPSPPPIPPSLCSAANNVSPPTEMASLESQTALTQSLNSLINNVSRVPTSNLNYSSSNSCLENMSSIPKPDVAVSGNSSDINTTGAVPTSNDANATATSINTSSVSNILSSLDIDELFKKLIASGIVPNSNVSIADNEKTVEEPAMNKPETLRRIPLIFVSQIHSGVQCNACGTRFSADNMVSYSRHLDRHFRQNKKRKNRSITFRSLYYPASEWCQLDIMDDDDDEKIQSWFETHQKESSSDNDDVEEVSSVAVGENADTVVCELCLDKFEQFYHDETEEWYFKNAMKVNDRYYHPICYESRVKKSEEIIDLEADDEEEIEKDVTNAMETVTEQQRHSDKDETNAEKTSAEEKQEEMEPSIIDDEVITDEVVLTESETDKDVVEIVKIKEEKIDLSDDDVESAKVKPPVETNAKQNIEEPPRVVAVANKDEQEESEESDVEEVQLIEQPIEEIIIHDDVEPNLETLNMEEMIAVQNELDNSTEASDELLVDLLTTPSADRVVDITNSGVTYSMDGNIEMEDAGVPKMVIGANKIKITIGKSSSSHKNTNGEVDINNDRKTPNTIAADDTTSSSNNKLITTTISDFGNLYDGSSEPPPPGVELFNSAKPKLTQKSLTVQPRVKKGKDVSALCTIM